MERNTQSSALDPSPYSKPLSIDSSLSLPSPGTCRRVALRTAPFSWVSSLLVGLPPWERPSLYQACGITSLLGKSACDQINSPRFGLALHGVILGLGYQISRIGPIPPLPYQSNHFDQLGLPTLRRARLSRFPALISEGKFHSSPLHISL